MKREIRDRLIIALDVETIERALLLVEQLRSSVGMFKIGSQLFTAAGPEAVREVSRMGVPIFLDLKFHDIPNTVASAAAEAAKLGVSIFNVHALGGSEMMRRALEAAQMAAERGGIARPRVIAVTALTSADQKTLNELGIAESPTAFAVRLAKLAAEVGLDGVVASPHEIRPVRDAVERASFLIVTPGVRPRWTAHHDQKRVMTPAEALNAGADYIVIGRAVLDAPDPARAVESIIEEIEDS
ncbi:orotidine-5'-phosphate decarboxylase [Pyrinomonas methylaliphatogenes]|jgi:orotidine-5'-phosphate decarboxylase|uniref:Orotidine 5'-phosphate decarboxylase n=1 Tax=Pyrinomonas methylaliphatogenes TaxID=454194 RepID=A0A0B6WWK8_9BACT|nr:orotidine-5'-phosphate decarboxylase [Pyrinomonas methylaliphatogenes]MBX5478305.1 orotidine-5'-phosphate decarboxylase [Pyrinomonas methylaliphatogenes]CDM64659.1 orotidine-5'-phosphate decarboxylase [Pyrinomonas methylaliphatogenes]